MAIMLRTARLEHRRTIDEKSPTTGDGGYLPCGVAWYRKTFRPPAGVADGKLFVDFDGVMAHGEVWINGHALENGPTDTSASATISRPGCKPDPANPTYWRWRTDTSQQPASRWYTGAGIYRNVRLVATGPVHVDHWGVFVTTPAISAKEAAVCVETVLVNESDRPRTVVLRTTLIGPARQPGPVVEASQDLPAWKPASCRQTVPRVNPALWNLDTPNLYGIETVILENGKAVDRQLTPFGIRTIRFEPATGFYLNGRNLKLKGVCLHHDAGCVGTAVPLAVWAKRFKQLKELGCNALRTSHNPVDPGFLDLADRMGLLVMEEAYDVWGVAKRPFDGTSFFRDWAAQDLRDMVRRDRNHPSIFLYSTGNEIPGGSMTVAELHGEKKTARPATAGAKSPKPSWFVPEKKPFVFEMLRDIVHATDPTRPMTTAWTGHSFKSMAESGAEDEAADVAGATIPNNCSWIGAGRNRRPARLSARKPIPGCPPGSASRRTPILPGSSSGRATRTLAKPGMPGPLLRLRHHRQDGHSQGQTPWPFIAIGPRSNRSSISCGKERRTFPGKTPSVDGAPTGRPEAARSPAARSLWFS